MDTELNNNQSDQESPVRDIDPSAIEAARLTLLRAMGKIPNC
jgi:hypothetical protein